MKNLIFILMLTIACSNVANAQVGAETGLNMANMSLKSAGTSIGTSYKPGFAIGLVADMPFSKHVFFEPGVFFDMTGCKTTAPKGSYSISTLRFPINIEYKSGERCGARFLAGVGIYIGNNLSGTATVDANGTQQSASSSFKIGSDASSNLKAMDFGVGFNIGYQLRKRIYARAHYQVGLTNLFPNGDSNNSIKTSEFGITVGYVFVRCFRSKAYDPFKIQSSSHWRGMSKGKYSRHRRYQY